MLGVQSDGPGYLLGISFGSMGEKLREEPWGWAGRAAGLPWGFRSSESGAKQEAEEKLWGQGCT